MAAVEQVAAVGRVLVNPGLDLTRRFRALFTLRNLGGEALGAIGDSAVVDLLKEYSLDPVIEVAETCQLAVRRLEWLLSGGETQLEDGSIDNNPYCSVDPAPPAPRMSVPELRSVLLDESLPLFERYRAMFALRNLGTEEAVVALGDGLQCSSALFRHEIGYVLGQMQHPAAIPALRAALERSKENPMVRHEAAEALGSIGKEECLAVLQSHLRDQERVVKESCEVALDMLEYENSDKFQYADGLVSLQDSL
ncbi:deoxyhypusine hydroxylase isoform X3 [Fundulus heteroclitus]|nr:deoxyhypusine hydroxylase isoform X3 [Fundulus heteroclitus]